MEFIDLSEYANYSIVKKLEFFDEKALTILCKIESKKIYKFLKSVILDNDENSYIRKKALEIMLELIYINKIKQRYALTIMIEEWESSKDVFLEIYRIKTLSLFYDEEPEEINDLLQQLSQSPQYEIATESLYQLGLVNLLSANSNLSKKDFIESLNNSISYFNLAKNSNENRIDAQIYIIICLALNSVIKAKVSEFEVYLKNIRKLIWEKRVFSFNDKSNNLEVGIYRTLCNFGRIIKHTPEKWLDYRKEFNQLCYYFYELKNQEVHYKLMSRKISCIVSDNLIKRSLEPYFSVNFRAQICKIDMRLSELNEESDEYIFLKYIRNIAIDSQKSGLVSLNFNCDRLKNILPNIDNEKCQNILERVKTEGDLSELLNALEEKSSYSYENLVNSLISACLKIQGIKLYKDASEDDRNTFIASQLEASGFMNKDQTRWGTSHAGKSAGEVDILVTEKDGKPFSVIEALNLDSLKKDYLNLHLNKIFKYDTSGLKYNFIIVYSTVGDYSTFWNKYVDHVSSYKYPVELEKFEIDESFDYTNIRIGVTRHKRNGKITNLYHVCIDMNNF